MSNSLIHSPLNKRSMYIDTYDKSLLFPIPREEKRTEIQISSTLPLPFYGYDLWTAYELSWLDLQGKPVVAVGNIIIPCESVNLIESKSLKLYFNSFNNFNFDSKNSVERLITLDLSAAVQAPVEVKLHSVEYAQKSSPSQFPGVCLDDLDVACTTYTVNADLLQIHDERVNEMTVYSHLLKSNCLVTGQPDWGSIFISYSGRRINEASLLQYLVSFRNHNEFHEQCVERIFMDLSTHCCPETLTVYARYTRRGGVDINPIRSSLPMNHKPDNQPLFRQ